MLKKETIEKIAKIENNPFIIHILNRQNINVKDLLMIMGLCGNKANAEKIKNLILPEMDCAKESEKPKKAVFNTPSTEPKKSINETKETKETEDVAAEIIEVENITTEEIETEEISAEEIKTLDIMEDNVEQKIEEVVEQTEEEPLNEPTAEAPEVTAIEEVVTDEASTEKTKKKGGRKKKVVEEHTETSK